MKRLLCISFLFVAGCESKRPHPAAAAPVSLPNGYQAVALDGATAGLPGDWKPSDLKQLDSQPTDMSGDPGKAMPGVCRNALSMFIETGDQGVVATPPSGAGVISLATHLRRDAVVASDAARDFANSIDRSPLHTGAAATQEPTTLGGKPAVKIIGHLNGSSTGDASQELIVIAIIGSSDKVEWRVVSVSPNSESLPVDDIAATWKASGE